MKSWLVVGCLLLSAPVAVAADHFQVGCQHYKTGDYARARNELQLAVKANPKNWQAQYQLANSLLQLRDYPAAKAAYRGCLNAKPSPEIQQHCEKALAFFDAPPPSRQTPQRIAVAVKPSESDESVEKQQATLSGDSTASAPLSARDAAIEQRKAMIRADEKRQIEALKHEEAAAMQDGNASSNRRWRNIETGERFTGMNPDEEGAVKGEFAARLSRIHDETERRLRGCTAP